MHQENDLFSLFRIASKNEKERIEREREEAGVLCLGVPLISTNAGLGIMRNRCTNQLSKAVSSFSPCLLRLIPSGLVRFTDVYS